MNILATLAFVYFLSGFIAAMIKDEYVGWRWPL